MQIPTFVDSQVLQPGNPVPIGTLDSPMADAMAYLGKSMVNLGNEMDKEEKKKKGRIGELTVEAAAEDWEMQQRIYNQTAIKDAASRKDITGLDMLKKANSYGTELATKMSDQYGFTPELNMMFAAKIKTRQNQLNPELMLASAKATEEDYKSAVDATLNITTGKIFQNPALTEQYMAQVVNDTVADYDKGLVLNLDKALAERKSQVMLSAVNKFKVVNSYDEALKLITANATLFPAEEVDKQVKEIKAARTQFYNDANAKDIAADRAFDKSITQAQTDNAMLMYAKIEAAGGMGSFEVARVKQEVTAMMLSGTINQESGKALLAQDPSVNKELSDPAVTGKVLEKAFRTGNFNAAIKDLNKEMKNNRITMPAYLDTLKELGRYKTYQQNRNSDKSWDTAKMVLNATLDYYKNIGVDPGSLDSVQTGKRYQIVMKVLQEAEKMQKRGGVVDMRAITDDIIPSKFGSQYSPVAPNTSNGVQTKGLDGIEKEIKDKLRRLNDRNIPPSEKQKDLYDVKQLEKRRQLLIKEGAGRGTNAGFTSSGTRSSNATGRTN